MVIDNLFVFRFLQFSIHFMKAFKKILVEKIYFRIWGKKNWFLSYFVSWNYIKINKGKKKTIELKMSKRFRIILPRYQLEKKNSEEVEKMSKSAF